MDLREATRNGYLQRLKAGRESRGWHLDPPQSYAHNPKIRAWWTDGYDDLLGRLVAQFGWGWHQEALGPLLESIPDQTLKQWQEADPLCKQYAYYNVLLNFAVARAQKLGLEDDLVVPPLRTCAVCTATFDERSIKAKWCASLGAAVCGVCLAKALTIEGDPTADREAVLSYIRDLVDLLERIPPQTFVEPIEILASLESKLRVEVIQGMAERPTATRTNQLFGSWLEALIAAGVLEGDAHRTGRGIRCLAEDGDVCLSIGEKTIDDLMYRAGVPHEKEPPYPEGRMRADFRVGSTLVEYLGLTGNPEYDQKTETKRDVCANHGIALVEILPTDLADLPKLEKRLKSLEV